MFREQGFNLSLDHHRPETITLGTTDLPGTALPIELAKRMLRIAIDLESVKDAESFISALDENIRLWKQVREIQPEQLDNLPPHFRSVVLATQKSNYVCFDDEEIEAMIRINKRLSARLS